MKLRKLLPITLFSALLLGLGACNTTPAKGYFPEAENEDGVHTFVINNLESLNKDWPQANKETGGSVREIDISIFTNGVEGKPVAELYAGNLKVYSEDPKIIFADGLSLTSGKMGTTRVAVVFYETVKFYSFTITDKAPEPDVIKNKSIAEIKEQGSNLKNTVLFEAEGVVAGAANDINSELTLDSTGLLYLYDPAHPKDFLYIYCSRADDGQHKFEWDGTAEEYLDDKFRKETPENVTENVLTKDLKTGDTIKATVIRCKSYDNFYALITEVTPLPVVEATSVTLDQHELSLTTDSDPVQLNATIEPENCTQKAVWNSSNKNVATVKNGVVTPKTAGTATITVTVGEETDECVVTVTPGEYTAATMTKGTNAYDDVTVNEKAAIKVGKSSEGGDMTITVPSGATELVFFAGAWSGSSNPSISVLKGETELGPKAILAVSAFSGSGKAFTVENESELKVVVALSDITAETQIKLTASIRFIVWSAMYK